MVTDYIYDCHENIVMICGFIFKGKITLFLLEYYKSSIIQE